MISLLIFGCMVYACSSLVMCFHWHGDFHGLEVVSSLPFYFIDIDDVVGSPLFFICSQVLYGFGFERTLWSLETTWVELLFPRACRLVKTLWSLSGLVIGPWSHKLKQILWSPSLAMGLITSSWSHEHLG